jgi:hypothetical protein
MEKNLLIANNIRIFFRKSSKPQKGYRNKKKKLIKESNQQQKTYAHVFPSR